MEERAIEVSRTITVSVYTYPDELQFMPDSCKPLFKLFFETGHKSPGVPPHPTSPGNRTPNLRGGYIFEYQQENWVDEIWVWPSGEINPTPYIIRREK